MQKNLKLFKDTWSVLWKNYKKLIINYTLNCLFSAVFPLISIYASARMIDGIVNKMPVRFVGKWAVIALLSVFFIQIIIALTNKIQNTYNDKKYEIFFHILSENTMNWITNNPKIQKLLEKIEYRTKHKLR